MKGVEKRNILLSHTVEIIVSDRFIANYFFRLSMLVSPFLAVKRMVYVYSGQRIELIDNRFFFSYERNVCS